jgi:hypothetical protein
VTSTNPTTVVARRIPTTLVRMRLESCRLRLTSDHSLLASLRRFGVSKTHKTAGNAA